jgi:hypothetical protein
MREPQDGDARKSCLTHTRNFAKWPKGLSRKLVTRLSSRRVIGSLGAPVFVDIGWLVRLAQR